MVHISLAPTLVLKVFYYYYYYTVIYSTSALRNFTLPMRDDFLYITHTSDFPLHSPDSQIIQSTTPPNSLDDQRTTVITSYKKAEQNS